MSLVRAIMGYYDPVYVESLRRELEEEMRLRQIAEAAVSLLRHDLAVASAKLEAVLVAVKPVLARIDRRQHMFHDEQRELANADATIVAVEGVKR